MNLVLPNSIEEALSHRAAGATPVAGATDLWVHWPQHRPALEAPTDHTTFVDLSGITILRGILESRACFRLGALATYWDVMQNADICRECPVLAAAAWDIGAVQIQTRGTWAGNIANGSPAADGVLALMAHDAEVELASIRGVRRERLEQFYTGYRTSIAAADELITAVIVPRCGFKSLKWEKVGARRAQAITKVGLAACRDGAAWRVCMNSVAPVVKRCGAVEALLGDGRVTLDRARAAVASDIAPIDDIRSTREYRLEVAARLVVDLATKG